MSQPTFPVTHWFGKPAPSHCDLCPTKFDSYFVDGALKSGKWCFMCPNCHFFEGQGIAWGKGQQYDVKTLALIAGGPPPLSE